MAWDSRRSLWHRFRRSLLEDIARTLPVKTRRIVGIILLSGGIILSIIGLVLMNLFQDECTACIVPGQLIFLILPVLGVISMVM
ncbi:MAG: hypothetical protein QGH38_04150, partial [Candidatus Thalassarchaeaceae archaeon]|nr:hypothetical protein [Candidatus Thalassarchaeaceae archaeon]